MKAELSKIAGNAIRADVNDVVRLIEELRGLPSNDPKAVVLEQAFARSFRVIWAVMCGFAGVVMAASFAVREYSMVQKHVTDQGYRGTPVSEGSVVGEK
jgi:hypothetical protein